MAKERKGGMIVEVGHKDGEVEGPKACKLIIESKWHKGKSE